MNDSECYRKIFLFLLSFKWCSQNEFESQFIYLFTASFVRKNTHATYSHILENDKEQRFN